MTRITTYVIDVRRNKRPISCLGVVINPRWYIAGTAATKRPVKPPAEVAAVWTAQFSFGPK